MDAKSNVIFVGSGSMLRSCVEIAKQSGLVHVGLVAARKDSQGRHSFIQSFCERREIPILIYETKLALVKQIAEMRPDILISIYNIDILDMDLLCPDLRAINFHEAPLPKYAGVNSPAWALLHGERLYGVTWHKMTRAIDAGDIVAQAEFLIDPSWSILDLEMKCVECGISSFRDLLPSLVDGTMNLRPQDLKQRSYFSAAVKPFGGRFPFSLETDYLQRLCRATSYFPAVNPFCTPKISINGKEFCLLRFNIVAAPNHAAPGTILQIDGEDVLFALSDAALRVNVVQSSDGQQMSAGEFLRSRELEIGHRANIDLPSAFTKEGLLISYNTVSCS